MILAEKILTLRSAQGWSQEELAEKLGVSRQSVSKWESAASIPDLNKILQMSQVFGVSTDYLLKDEMEAVEYSGEEETSGIRISLKQAEEFLTLRVAEYKKIAVGVMMCILSPVLLILLPVMAIPEPGEAVGWFSEEVAAGIGLTALLVIVAAAVALFVIAGMRLSRYEAWEKNPIELDYGVKGILEERLKASEGACTRNIVLGVVLCILSPIPLVAAALFGAPDVVLVALVCVLLALVAVAVVFFITSAPLRGGCQILLRMGDYTPENIEKQKKTDRIGGIYWPIVVAVYLAISFISDQWGATWIIWPVAAVAFGAISALVAHK